jgi:hypothetical protein
VYLQENLATFFENDVTRFYSFHEELVRILIIHSNHDDKIEDNMFVTDGQIIIFLTAAIIELDLISKNVTLFQNWVQFLLSIAAQANRSINRVYRQMACECLHELETNFPGLLSQYVFIMIRWCQLECTHALQSYTTLMIIVLDHWCQKVIVQYHQEMQATKRNSTSSTESDQSSIISTTSIKSTASIAPQIPTTFVVPPLLRSSIPNQFVVTVPTIQPENKKELHQCLSFIVENVNLLTPWAKASIMDHINRLIPWTEFPSHVMNSAFKSFLYGANPLLVHMHLLSNRQGIERISIMNRDFSM